MTTTYTQPVQAPGYTDGCQRSATELARIVAKHKDLHVDGGDSVVTEDRTVICESIEDLAAILVAAGAIRPSGVFWSRFPNDPQDFIAWVGQQGPVDPAIRAKITGF